jgi:magnesium-transporting ATPase (P-type)
MTVVLRSQEATLVFTKGADTSIEKILAPNQRYLQDIKKMTN